MAETGRERVTIDTTCDGATSDGGVEGTKIASAVRKLEGRSIWCEAFGGSGGKMDGT